MNDVLVNAEPNSVLVLEDPNAESSLLAVLKQVRTLEDTEGLFAVAAVYVIGDLIDTKTITLRVERQPQGDLRVFMEHARLASPEQVNEAHTKLQANRDFLRVVQERMQEKPPRFWPASLRRSVVTPLAQALVRDVWQGRETLATRDDIHPEEAST